MKSATPTVPLRDVVAHLDEYLRIREVPDYPGALNGLQVERRRPEVARIAVAVDAGLATLERAVALEADLLIVHHGLFWDGNQPLTGRRYRRVRPAIEADLAVYAVHLPLDVHPEVGNNAVLARALGMEPAGSFGVAQGQPIGVWGELEIGREALCARLDALLNTRVLLVPGGPERIRRLGVVTGGAASLTLDAAAAGLDALITGEGSHQHYFDAREGGINLYLGGHYATETWGVRALGQHLSERFGIPYEFIDLPTGL